MEWSAAAAGKLLLLGVPSACCLHGVLLLTRTRRLLAQLAGRHLVLAAGAAGGRDVRPRRPVPHRVRAPW